MLPSQRKPNPSIVNRSDVTRAYPPSPRTTGGTFASLEHLNRRQHHIPFKIYSMSDSFLLLSVSPAALRIQHVTALRSNLWFANLGFIRSEESKGKGRRNERKERGAALLKMR
ncbi:histidinol-phosphate aminotransferase [Striga asiatica]|uniref:Histidinol-phosphate aminotransferase n=1 Tax=Striga asiatica TaxID=4170 RepID=A0A5A7R9S7_STRAF|nr:histidinol-phosphate aminotransferase [Striga asiatica]